MSDAKSPQESPGAIARDWWQKLLHGDPSRKLLGDRAAVAKLRRCGTVEEAMQEPAALLLFRRLGGRHARDLPRAALVAAVLAHVRLDNWVEVPGVTTARLIGPTRLEAPETALVKPLRFRRLMEATEWNEQLTAFRRLVDITRGKLPVQDLAEMMLHWTDRLRRREWVLQYWNAVPPPAPNQPASTDAMPKDAAP